ncbi:MAG TPA: hypothetical protein VFU54_12490 [Actinomycetota bacterium]|nr:hypothetical protein [Actinomycetota bacterium]
MALLWFVLAIVVVDLAATLFAAETRPGFVENPRWWHRRRLSD